MRFAFQVCKDLGIDDPVAWFNAVPPQVVDSWLAYYLLLHDEQTGGDMQKMTPDQALQQLMNRMP